MNPHQLLPDAVMQKPDLMLLDLRLKSGDSLDLIACRLGKAVGSRISSFSVYRRTLWHTGDCRAISSQPENRRNTLQKN